ncbi:Beta-xylosidase GH3 [Carnimonas sp. R-84981]|uniref:beta-glucosidase BglX n=1 Tax=Carnimonas bestiolae TaxID=3402172 RepID=UPI003EDC21AE
MASPSATPARFFNLDERDYAAAEQRCRALLARMTLAEKVGQMSQFTSDRDTTGPSIREGYQDDIREGRVGSIFNAFDADFTRQLQTLAVNESRLGIPLLFGYDVVHGFRTIFPIPLAMASSWHPEGVEAAARVAATEAAAAGIHWAFAPMVDVSRDARWGRVMEGAGEDPLLSSRMASAQVRGYQGHDPRALDSVAACVKHYAGYGAAEAGRDYNSVDLSERVMRSVHLPPHQAAVNAGVASVMTSFNTVDGVPASCNALLLRQILRDEWQFRGLVVTDYTAIMELLEHGVAADARDAARLAVNAGVDMDMQDGYFLDHLAELVEADDVSAARIDEATLRVLILKDVLGLFEDPYRYCDEAREATALLAPEHRRKAREMAQQSMVLLENNDLLPLSPAPQRLAVIGELADSRADLLGPWHGNGHAQDAHTLLEALRGRLSSAEIYYHAGVPVDIDDTASRQREIAEAVTTAQQADVAVVVVGEKEPMSGEAASRTDLGLPGQQLALALAILASGTPTVVVTLSGRPLVLSELTAALTGQSAALLHGWWPGSEGAEALVDLLLGDVSPCARLPMSFPRSVGQLPLYYGQLPTGRPVFRENPDPRYSSKYIDSPNTPLYPFGYGLSYTHVDYATPQLDKPTLTGPDDQLTLNIELTNTGERDGVEVVQLYLRDPVASISRPVRELIDFKRIEIAAGARERISFIIRAEQLGFIGSDLRWRCEAGRFELHIGAHVEDTQTLTFDYQP